MISDLISFVMNQSFQKNVTFILRPRECDANTKLVLMVSSGPGNAVFRYLDHRGGVSQAHMMTCSRSRWRRAVAEHAQLKVVFVVAEARTVKQQQQLLGEHRVHGDIVQSSVQDSASKSSIRRKSEGS